MYKYILTAFALFFLVLFGCSFLFPASSGAPLCLSTLIAVSVICTGIIVERVKKEAQKIREMLQPPTDEEDKA